MQIGIYHGYELTGSGSNEYTRYLSKTLYELGYEVHIICREPNPEDISFISKAYSWNKEGKKKEMFSIKKSGCTLHQLPNASVQPVYLTDKQRPGNVKSFVALSKDELDGYHKLNKNVLHAILNDLQLNILHTNHLIYQPIIALEVCQLTGTPFIIYPHGSSIEYVIKFDERYRSLALKAIIGSTGLIIGNKEVRDRIIKLYPDHTDDILLKTKIVGVGVDTSLFKPILKRERERNIQELINTNGKGGKSPELTTELFARLKEMEIESTQDYYDKYDHSSPDTNLNEKLSKIPWHDKILLYVGALTSGKGLQSLIVSLPVILARHPGTQLVIVGAGAYREVLEGLYYAIKTSNISLLSEFCNKGMDLDRNDLIGPWEDIQIFMKNSEYLTKINKNGHLVENHVHFLGRLDHSRLKYLFPCSDLAIFPSIVPEAYPLVLMESLAIKGVLKARH